MSSRSVVLTQLAIADYRDKFIELLGERLPQLEVQVGEQYFESSTRTSSFVRRQRNVDLVCNRYAVSRKAVWQRLRWRRMYSADVVVGELNPRIVSTWVLLLIRRLLGKRTLLWGHAWPRAGAEARSERLRRVMRSLSSGLILYTESQRQELQQRYPESVPRCFVAPNALYRRAEMVPCEGDKPTDFIYVGRLVASKKVHVLLQAFRMYVIAHPESNLHIVGTGDQDADLRNFVREQGIPGVVFHGHIAELNELREIYRTCVASVSPGYVGLSVTQSFSLGVPMIISRTESHSPEIECVVEGVNASFFETDVPASLFREMESSYQRAGGHAARAQAISADCKERYSVERMVAGFIEAISA